MTPLSTPAGAGIIRGGTGLVTAIPALIRQMRHPGRPAIEHGC